MSNTSKFVTALIGMLLMAFIVSWELCLFVVDRAGARSHLWLALGAVILACGAGSMMFLFFSRYQEIKWSKVETTPASEARLMTVFKKKGWRKDKRFLYGYYQE